GGRGASRCCVLAATRQAKLAKEFSRLVSIPGLPVRSTSDGGRNGRRQSSSRRCNAEDRRGTDDVGRRRGGSAGDMDRPVVQPGKNINTSGSATLVAWLLSQGLLDERNLLLFPIGVGHGKRLFGDEGPRPH